MTEFSQSIYASLLIPLLGAILIYVFRNYQRIIEFLFVGTSLCLLGVTVAIVNMGDTVFHRTVTLFEFIDSVPLAFHIEPLGILYACVASGLWLVTTIYAIGYMNANKEKHLARFIYVLLHCHDGGDGHCLRRKSADPVYFL